MKVISESGPFFIDCSVHVRGKVELRYREEGSGSEGGGEI